MDFEIYYQIEKIRVANNFNPAVHTGFVNKEVFSNWFIGQLKKYDCCCYYCDTSIHDINRLIDAGYLKERQTGNGRRGRILEIDKESIYSEESCVLACLYCNNDKSNTTSREEYKLYFGPNRKAYFKTLLSKL